MPNVNQDPQLIIVPSQTAMQVGLMLAQSRDDSTDVGPTLGQRTLLSEVKPQWVHT